LTARAVALAARTGASVEAEIGSVPKNERGSSPLPSPADVAAFVAATGVDALAVAVGTVHGYYKDKPRIDLDLARRAGEAVAIPLVLHGGTGTPEETVRAIILSGFAKVNIATEFQHCFQKQLLARLSEAGDDFVPLDKLMLPVIEVTAKLLQGHIRMFSDPDPRIRPPLPWQRRP
jgi:fructose/tagatose bisphosphate aldolase